MHSAFVKSVYRNFYPTVRRGELKVITATRSEWICPDSRHVTQHVTKGAAVAVTCHDDVKSFYFRSAPEGTTPLAGPRDRRAAGWFVVVVHSRSGRGGAAGGLVNIDEVISQAIARSTRSAVGKPFRVDSTCPGPASIMVPTAVLRVCRATNIVKHSSQTWAAPHSTFCTYTVCTNPHICSIIHRTEWRHSNLWSQYDLCVVGQHGVMCEVKWWRFVALFE